MSCSDNTGNYYIFNMMAYNEDFIVGNTSINYNNDNNENYDFTIEKFKQGIKVKNIYDNKNKKDFYYTYDSKVNCIREYEIKNDELKELSIYQLSNDGKIKQISSLGTIKYFTNFETELSHQNSVNIILDENRNDVYFNVNLPTNK